jgi:hypothetical protein
VFGGDRVGLIDGGLQQGVQPVPRECPECGCEACIDEPGLVFGEVSGGGGDVAALVGRRPVPLARLSRSLGSRCRRSRASPMSFAAAPSEMRSVQPSSAAAKSAMVGVPSPPSRMGCWVPGTRLCGVASPG